jgi:hypothetical protein
MIGAAFARVLPARVPVAARAAIALAIALPGGAVAVRANVIASRLDTRTEAARFMEANAEPGARVLNDKGWVPLRYDVVRCQELLTEARADSGDGAFQVHRGRQYELMLQAAERSSVRAFHVTELDPAWWEHRERPDGDYAASPHDHDMGNPNAVREPKTLEEYRKDGVRYVVTTSKTYRLATNPVWRERWPKFARFYDELARLEPILEIEESPDRPGPTVRIYDLMPERPGARHGD